MSTHDDALAAPQQVAQLLNPGIDHFEFAKVRTLDAIGSGIAGRVALVPTGANCKGIVA